VQYFSDHSVSLDVFQMTETEKIIKPREQLLQHILEGDDRVIAD
jgi:hypothetical protein